MKTPRVGFKTIQRGGGRERAVWIQEREKQRLEMKRKKRKVMEERERERGKFKKVKLHSDHVGRRG